MKISSKGFDLIKQFEGCQLNAYQCAAGRWTIGYGHTHNVKPGDLITREQAEAFLRQDIRGVEKAVSQQVNIPLTQQQFDALCALVFNIGTGHFSRSTLLKKLNAGDIEGTADEFLRRVHAGGKKHNGLLKRRHAERELFLCPSFDA